MSAPRDDGGAAFPYVVTSAVDGVTGGVRRQTGESGMSLRDYFAAATLPLAAMHIDGTPDLESVAAREIARICYVMADAMLAARKGGA